MIPIFADTFFFLAFLNPKDTRFHVRAVEMNRVDHPILTTAWVLLELADHLCDAHNRRLFGQVRQALAMDTRYEILPVDQILFDRAVTLYKQRHDKDWSLTDCTSFLVMQDRGLTDALTGDRHFEQAGFRLLLTPDSHP
ncbi:MAG: PIN domain-containing protein [Tepidisphaeraceae bacterium]|jgi:predicted nucleic acid-binding protein